MTILRILNNNKNKTPDEIVSALRTGDFLFHPCGLITRDFYNKINLSERVCYFKWSGQLCWDNETSTENVPLLIQRSFDDLYLSLSNWALIEYDKRFEVDPFNMDWDQYVEEYQNHVVHQ